MAGDVIFIMLTIIKNIMNPINQYNPAFANLFPIINFFSMTHRAETENNVIAGIIRDTNIDLLGNSKGEKEEIVRRIRMPAIIAASSE
jgi:hypothetical protein